MVPVQVGDLDWLEVRDANICDDPDLRDALEAGFDRVVWPAEKKR